MSKYEDPYQPTSSRESKTEVILGIAVAMMVLSRATTKRARQRPKESMASVRPPGYLDSSSVSSSYVLSSLTSFVPLISSSRSAFFTSLEVVIAS